MNEDNNIELPKRVDEEPNPIEKSGNGQNENMVKQSEDVGQNLQEQNIIFPTEEEINRENVAKMQHAPIDNNIFDQNIKDDINNVPESSFAPIENLEKGLDVPTQTQTVDQIDILTTPETPEMETISTNQIEESPTNNEAVAIEQTQAKPSSEEENSQLNKKIVSVDPIKKEKSKGNPIVGFFALLLILAIILAAFYYFIKMEYIIVPDELKNKIPFFSTTTTAITTTNESITENQNINEEDLSLISVVGEYTQTPPLVCPDAPAKLLLNQDNNFTYNQLSFDEENNNCNITEVTGSYVATDGVLELIPIDNSIIIGTASYDKNENAIIINIINEDKTITLTSN
ncbi:MAG: hypothetical protein PHX04_06830 [Bacilli bacterium]|nr:hypothetical protein [Bacilli bacterium]